MQVFSQEVQLWLPGAQLLCPWSQSQLCQSCPEPSPQPLQCTQYSVISLILSIFSHMHVFGGTERDSEKSFMVEVPQRNVATLLYSNTYFKYSNPITYRRMMFLGVSLVMQNWINHLQWWMEGIPDPSQSWIHTQDCDPQPVVCWSTPHVHTPRQWRDVGRVQGNDKATEVYALPPIWNIYARIHVSKQFDKEITHSWIYCPTLLQSIPCSFYILNTSSYAYRSLASLFLHLCHTNFCILICLLTPETQNGRRCWRSWFARHITHHMQPEEWPNYVPYKPFYQLLPPLTAWTFAWVAVFRA
jgi:hypothetical protein